MNLSCNDCAQCSSVRKSRTPPGADPALFTRISMRPSAVCASFTNASPSAGLVRSAGIGTILRFVSRAICDAAAARGSLRRAQIATSTPSRASAKAIALPIPALPPVTSAVFPFIWRSMSFPQVQYSDEDLSRFAWGNFVSIDSLTDSGAHHPKLSKQHCSGTVRVSVKLHVRLGSARRDRRVATAPRFVYRHQLLGPPCAAVGEDAR